MRRKPCMVRSHLPSNTKELFDGQPITRLLNARDTLEGKPVLRRKVGNLPPIKPGTGSTDELTCNQLRCLMFIDEGVGRVLEALQETNQFENTVIIFTCDNGYLWGEHGLSDKRAAYEESIRIPLLVRYPHLIKQGSARRTCDEHRCGPDAA